MDYQNLSKDELVNELKEMQKKYDSLKALYHSGITENIQTKEALSISEEKFKVVFDNARDGILLAGIEDKKFLNGNETICRMLGYSIDEIKNMEVMDIHPEKDIPYVIDQFERQSRKEITLAKDIPVKRKDGSVFYADINSSPVTIADRQFLMGIFRDITERRLAEEKFHALSLRYESILASVPDIIMEVNIDKKYTWANKSGIEFFGEDVVGKDASFYFEGEQDTYDKVEPLFKGNENIFYVESWQRNKEGQKKFLAWWCHVLKDQNDIVTGALSTARDITESRFIKEALIESENKYHTLFEKTNGAIIITDTETGIIIDTNPSAEKLLGRERNEIIGYNRLLLHPPEESDLYTKHFQDHVERGSVVLSEADIIRKDGNRVPVVITSNVMEIQGRKVILGIFQDVSEKKIAEEELKKSEYKFRNLVETTNDIIWEADATGKYTYMSPQAKNILGYSPEELIGCSPFNFMPLDEAMKIKKISDRIVASEKPFNSLININLHKDGHMVIFETSGVPVFGTDGRFEGYRGINRDVTKRIKKEEALRESESSLKQAQEIAKMGSWEWNMVTHENKWSDNYFVLLGLKRGEVEPSFMIYKSMIHPDDLHIFDEKHSANIKDKVPSVHELRLLMPDGTVKWIQSNVFPVVEDGIIVKLRGVIIDVTERKQAEQVLHAKHELFRKTFNFSPLASVLTKIPGRIVVEVNQAFIDLFGYTAAEVIGKPVNKIDLWADSLERERVAQILLAKGKVNDIEFVFKTKTGKTGYGIFNSVVIEQIDEKYVLTRVLDITERKQAEEISKKHYKEKRLLSEVSEKLVTLEDINEINLYVGEIVFKLVPDAYIFISTYNPERKSVKITHTFGFRRYIKAITDKLGLDPFGLEVKISEMTEEELKLYKSRALVEIPEGLYALSARKIKRSICSSVEKMLSVRKIITMGFSWQDRLFGCVTILMKSNEKLENAVLIETIINQAAIKVQQRMSQEELRKSEENYRLLYDNAPVGLYRTTPDGKILLANKILVNMLGFSSFNELSKRNLEQDGFGLEFPRKNFIRQIEKNDEIINLETKWLCHNGKVIDVRENAQVIRDSLGMSLYYDGTVEDITERKKAEEEKNKAYEKYKEIFDASNDIIYTMDFKGNFTSVSPSAEKVLGYRFEALADKNMTNFISEETAKIAFDNIAKKLKGEEVSTVYEVEFRNSNGTYTNLEISSMIRYKDGQPVEIFGIARDVTEKKKLSDELNIMLQNLEEMIAERTFELSRSEELYYTTVNSFNSWVFVIDDHKKIIFANTRLRNFFSENGFRENIIGEKMKDVFKFLKKENFSRYDRVFKECVELENEGEYIVFGKKYFTHTKLSPVIRDNKVIRVVTTVHDHTKLKLVEDEIIKSLEKERELNALKSQFISTVSHEFRTPLAGIQSSTQLLKRYGDTWDKKKKEKIFKQIFDAVQHTKTLLDDVSLINKEESKRIVLKPSLLDLKKLLLDIVEENKLVYGPDFEIITAFNLKKSKYFFDREIIRYIIGNVLSNAIKYSGKSRKIQFNVTDINRELNFKITDFGLGIPAKDQEFLFEPFHRASNVETIQGTGFGLTIAKRFVDLHKGTIIIQSKIYKGTTVTIKLPEIDSKKNNKEKIRYL